MYFSILFFFSDAKILAETDEQLHWLKVGVGS